MLNTAHCETSYLPCVHFTHCVCMCALRQYLIPESSAGGNGGLLFIIAIANAAIFVVIVIIMTVVLVLLFKYKCYKVIHPLSVHTVIIITGYICLVVGGFGPASLCHCWSISCVSLLTVSTDIYTLVKLTFVEPWK